LAALPIKSQSAAQAYILSSIQLDVNTFFRRRSTSFKSFRQKRQLVIYHDTKDIASIFKRKYVKFRITSLMT